jgi:hypothetical protein
MSRKSELLNKRNDRLKARYKELASQKIKGKRKYTYGYILEMLSDEFFLSADWIGQILTTK